jgi:capsule polysaccharide export protein KpsC/LpsZ
MTTITNYIEYTNQLAQMYQEVLHIDENENYNNRLNEILSKYNFDYQDYENAKTLAFLIFENEVDKIKNRL